MPDFGALAGPGVAAGLLPAILFGGVLGASLGGALIYAGSLEDGTATDISLEEGAKPAAHSPYEALRASSGEEEQQRVRTAAASTFERKRVFGRGFAAMFL